MEAGGEPSIQDEIKRSFQTRGLTKLEFDTKEQVLLFKLSPFFYA